MNVTVRQRGASSVWSAADAPTRDLNRFGLGDLGFAKADGRTAVGHPVRWNLRWLAHIEPPI
jgi:hypothetical protein